MTKTDFDSQFGPIAMPKPFAQGGDVATIPFTQDGGNFNFDLGFDPTYSSPKSNNGNYVRRDQINAIGNLATRNDFHRRCGGLNTFDSAFAEAVGGYPMGAVLQYFTRGNLFYVVSLIDNNTKNFVEDGVDGIYWKFCFTSPDAPTSDAVFENVNYTTPITDAYTYTELLIKKTPRGGLLTISDISASFQDTNSIRNSFPSNMTFGAAIVACSFSDPSQITTFSDGFSSLYSLRPYYSDSIPNTNIVGGSANIVSDPPSGTPVEGSTYYFRTAISQDWALAAAPRIVNANDYIVIGVVNGYTSVERAVTFTSESWLPLDSGRFHYSTFSGIKFSLKII